jgi:hypothetical protein
MSGCFAVICRHVAIKIRWIMRLPVGRVVRSTNVQISLMPVASLMRAPGVVKMTRSSFKTARSSNTVLVESVRNLERTQQPVECA